MKSGRIVLIVVGSAVVAGAALGGIGAAVLGGPHSLQPKHPPVSLVNGQVPLDLPHPSKDWTPSRQHYCEMAGVGRATKSLTAPMLTGLEAGYAQVVSDYAPVAVHADTQAVAIALQARADHLPYDHVAARRAATRVDNYTKLVC